MVPEDSPYRTRTVVGRVSRQTWAIGMTAGQVGLFVATAFPWATHGLVLGAPTWHHNASLAAVLLLTAVWWRPMRRDRAFLGIGILLTTVLALSSGFVLLYLKQDLKAWELKDWLKFWHILWSWAALVWATMHTAINWRPFLRQLRRWHQRVSRAALFVGPWILLLVLIPVTWSPWGASVWTEASYIPATLWTWLVMVGVPYALWATVRLGAASPRWAGRPAMQGFIDVWLVPMTLLANLSGFPLLYFDTKATSLKYVAKYWHTWPSIAMAVLVFVHSIQFWSGVRRHWRVMGRTAAAAE